MKIFAAILAVFSTICLATALAGDRQKKDLQAIYNLSGDLQSLANKELTITFSDDMLPLGGKRDGAALIKISPAVRGLFTWRGNRTLAFKSESRFHYSTTYTATIPAGTRSLSGKTMPKEMRWQWSTPRAFPREIKTSSLDYFSSLPANEKLDFAVWVNDSLILRFEQPVSAAKARGFFILKEAKSGEPVSLQFSQKAADELAIRFAGKLRREMLYQFVVKKGFSGSEGSTGTDKEFAFTFETVPPFRYDGPQPVILRTDEPNFWLGFSNPIAEFNQNLITVFKMKGKEKRTLKFHLEPSYRGNENLVVAIEEELSSGDALSIEVGKGLTNIYHEQLPEKLELSAKVCSSLSPFIGFSMDENNLLLTTKSIAKAGIRMFKLTPNFYTQLETGGFGILQGKNFKADFIETEILENLENLPEGEKMQTLGDEKLGSPLGFFGFLVQKREPYNVCREIALPHRLAADPPELHVFHRRHMDMVIKAGKDQTLYWLYDNRSGQGLGQKPFFLMRSRETAPLGESGANGILIDEAGVNQDDLIIAKNPGSDDMALAKVGLEPVSARELRISVFSDRDFYKPGDTVHVAGIVKEYALGKVTSPQATTASLEIIGPDWQKVKTETLPLDRLGGFHYEYQSDPAGKKGRYQFQVRVQDGQSWLGQHGVTIDYYQPNTFEVTITDIAERYLFQDFFRPTVSGSYLAGNPMAGDGFSYSLEVASAAARGFGGSELERYAFGLDRNLASNDPSQQGKDKLDAGGKYVLGIPLKTFKKTNYLAGLLFTATGKSAEGKEFTARTQSVYFPGNYLTGIRIGYYHNLKERIDAELALVNFTGKPVSGKIRVTLYREIYEDYQRKLIKVTGPDDIFVDKTKTHAFRVPTAGRYVLRCDTPDPNGRVVSTSDSFFAWDSGYSDRDEGLRIECDREALHVGDKLKCFIRSSRAGQALVTVERGKILDSMVLDLQKMTLLELPVKKEYFPAIRVSVIAMFANNASDECTKEFQVLDEGKTMRVELESPGEIKPASKATVKIRTLDAQQKGVRAKLFVYAVDKGNLSLQDYQTPDPLRRFYYTDPLARSMLRTYYSKNYRQWTFARPTMDIDLPGPAIFGSITGPDAMPIAGAAVILEDEKHIELKTAVSSPQGYYSFPGLSSGNYIVKARAKGYFPTFQSGIYFNGSDHYPCDLVLIPVMKEKYWDLTGKFVTDEGIEGGIMDGVMGGVEGGVAPAMPMAAEKKMMARSMKGEAAADAEADTSGIRIRSDFREVLFFKTVETDEAGNAAIDFESSDQLSTYRIMAVAYNEDSFGRAEKELMVSKDLLISEAMPEFARQDDTFNAGVQLSNRTAKDLQLTLLAKPEGIGINGAGQAKRTLGPRRNELFQFPFIANRVGEARIVFYAVSAADKDGLEKKLPVTDRLVSETLLDFASGKSVKKMIEPQADGVEQTVSIKAAPSLLRPAVNIAKKLVFYPYECLEQRTSKVMPFLAFSPELAERLELGLDQEQIRAAVEGYLKIIPEFMNSAGALSYYRGGQYTSDYLTAYVLWALYLARERDYKVDTQLVQKLTGYLQRAELDKTCESFYQFVLSLHKEADTGKLKKLAAERDTLPLPGRVFLYRALHNQGIETDSLKTMLAEFNNSLQVEADFAYFDAGEYAYHRDYPFYSSRFATALILQAVLEVEHGHVLAERIINWLLECQPYCWNTTQTNFWILSAMDEYLKQVEKTTARRAEIVLLDEKTTKEFANVRDVLQVSKKLIDLKTPIEALVSADQPVYVSSELTWKLDKAGKKNRGIDIQRNVYNEKGEKTEVFRRGQVYQVELLIKADKEVPYGVIDEPLAAGFELLRQDIATTRSLKEFNTANHGKYWTPWARQENAADRLVYYTYSLSGAMRIVYFIKAMYSGSFTWMPAIAQGMYHPQYFGRTAIKAIEVRE
ncbi:MAG: Ig-like domain-containing protein [Candidatus Aminicenantes bacterium]|nr:Ig-like domain-containing protein [Candidatus Aminicenantes bacterium]